MNSRALPSSDDFYFRTLHRIHRLMMVLGIAALTTAGAMFGWRVGLGFALGGAIAFLNFYWLQKVVGGIGDLTANAGSPVSSRGIVVRFLLRYFVMAIVAFVILTVSRESLYGLFAGLFLPVAAMLCEAVFEVYRVISGK